MTRRSRNLLTLAVVAMAAFSLTATSADAETILYDFNSTTTAWDTAVKTSPVDTNDFGSGITASDYTFTHGGASNRHIAIIDGMAKAMESTGTDTHAFTITIPDLGGATVDLTQLSFDYGLIYEPGDWSLTLSQGTASQSSDSFAGSGTSAMTDKHYDIGLSGLSGLNDTTVTFTIADNAGGNNMNTTIYSYFDNVTLTGTVSAVPEPSTIGLAVSGLLGLIVFGRRRKR